MKKVISMVAPISGEIVPLKDVPDPVFSRKMVGDGVAIEPLDQILRAPCAGRITHLHPAGHAVTLRTEQDIEVLLHIGIDTVSLKGKGFRPVVRPDQIVSRTDPLIEFDLDFVAMNSRSLLTVVLVSDSPAIGKVEAASGFVAGGKDEVFSFQLASTTTIEATRGTGFVISDPIVVRNQNGFHARPSALIANTAKKYQGDVWLIHKDGKSNAKSVTSIMALGVVYLSEVRIEAGGADAAQAVSELSELILSGSGEEVHNVLPNDISKEISNTPTSESQEISDPNILRGVPASPGLSVGSIFRLHFKEIAVAEDGCNPDNERRSLILAIDESKSALSSLVDQARTAGDHTRASIFAAHGELLDDPELVDMALVVIEQGRSAAYSWKQAYLTHAERLTSMENELLAQRASDVRDVGERVLAALTGLARDELDCPAGSILVAEDLTPSETASLDREKVVGFCTARGGSTSHVAIIARSLGIPALVGVDSRVLDLANGQPVILDGDRGLLRINCSPVELEDVERRQERTEGRNRQNRLHAKEPAITLDGHKVEVFANIGGVSDCEKVADFGGDGVGLLRSEFLFMDRATAPDEEEQFKAYKAMAELMGKERTLVVRTLDVGGDKPLVYMPIPPEDNPFLGERGIRVSLSRPDIFQIQIRAVLRASIYGRLLLMFPMISTVSEMKEARGMVEKEALRLGVPPIPVGMMVEVPATAIMASQFASVADFFSIGTNDLTQYTLATDRGHARLAAHVDGLNPAVLKLIAESVEASKSRNIWAGICGGIASDPHAVPILVGLGVNELSVTLPAIPAVKAQIRNLDFSACRQLADKALHCDTAQEVRILVSKSMDTLD